MAKEDEALAKLNVVSTSLTKIGGETATLVQMVTDLQNAAQGNVPDSIMSKINDLATQAQSVDDLVPDAPVVPPAA